MNTITEFETSFEVKFKITVTRYIPERAARSCSNPSDFRYSEPGDREEMEYDVYFLLAGNKLIVPEQIMVYFRENIENAIREEMKYE